jgi:Peptidase M60, enhancin and enhancin-like
LVASRARINRPTSDLQVVTEAPKGRGGLRGGRARGDSEPPGTAQSDYGTRPGDLGRSRQNRAERSSAGRRSRRRNARAGGIDRGTGREGGANDARREPPGVRYLGLDALSHHARTGHAGPIFCRVRRRPTRGGDRLGLAAREQEAQNRVPRQPAARRVGPGVDRWLRPADLAKQISAGYMHSAYPIMIPIDGSITVGPNRSRLRGEGECGLVHELRHNHQSPMKARGPRSRILPTGCRASSSPPNRR